MIRLQGEYPTLAQAGKTWVLMPGSLGDSKPSDTISQGCTCSLLRPLYYWNSACSEVSLGRRTMTRPRHLGSSYISGYDTHHQIHCSWVCMVPWRLALSLFNFFSLPVIDHPVRMQPLANHCCIRAVQLQLHKLVICQPSSLSSVAFWVPCLVAIIEDHHNKDPQGWSYRVCLRGVQVLTVAEQRLF